MTALGWEFASLGSLGASRVPASLMVCCSRRVASTAIETIPAYWPEFLNDNLSTSPKGSIFTLAEFLPPCPLKVETAVPMI